MTKKKKKNVSPKERAHRVKKVVGPKSVRLTEEAEVVSKRGTDLKGTDDALRFLSALFGASFLVAACDGELAESERESLCETMALLTDGLLDAKTVDKMILTHLETLKKIGFEKAITAVGHSVHNDDERELVYTVAVAMSAVDGHVDPEEKDILTALASALQLPKAKAKAIADHVFQV